MDSCDVEENDLDPRNDTLVMLRCNFFSDDEDADLEPCFCEGEIVFDEQLAGKGRIFTI